MQIGVRMSEQERDALMEVAEKEGRSVSQQVRFYIRKAIEARPASLRSQQEEGLTKPFRDGRTRR